MKKVIAVIISVLTLIGATSVFSVSALSESEHLRMVDDASYTLGDVNEDGAFNAKDILALKKSVVGIDEPISTDASDVDADGCAGTRDVFYLKAFAAGSLNISDFVGNTPIYRLKIGGNDIEDFDIVLPEDTKTKESNAYLSATILKSYIASNAGYNISIILGESTKSHAIYYHQYDYLSEEAEQMSLGVENYVYRVVDGDLHIYGTLRGCMYATYEILEDYLGLRFFSRNYTYAYDKRCSDIPEGTDVYHEVQLEFRFSGYPVASGGELYQTYYALRCNGSCVYSGGDKRDGYDVGCRFIWGHSFGYFKNIQSVPLPGPESGKNIYDRIREKYDNGNNQSGVQDPVVYNSWQPCCSDDQEYYRMFNGMLEILYMLQNRSVKFNDEVASIGQYAMAFSINDSEKTCTCRICLGKIQGKSGISTSQQVIDSLRAHYTGDFEVNGRKVSFKKEGASGLFTDFANRAAKEISTEYHGYDYTYGEDDSDFPNLYRLDEEIRTVYKGIKLNFILYDHTVPESVKPNPNLQIMYVSHGCYNHVLGTGGCGDDTTFLGNSNKQDEIAMKAWSELCHETGASIWYYSHGVTYACWLAPSPNITDFYYNFKYIVGECNYQGILYESAGGSHPGFEALKAYLVSYMCWNPTATYEDFTNAMKEFLYTNYGDGYEELYQFILLQTAAGDANPCWQNNHDRPWDMYNEEFIAEHYEEMRELIITAESKARFDYQIANCQNLRIIIDFIGLSACYNKMYTNGTSASRQEYEARYTWMYNRIKQYNYSIHGDYVYTLPETIDFSVNPMTQFIKFGSWRTGV